MLTEYLQPLTAQWKQALSAHVNARSLFHSVHFFDGTALAEQPFDLVIIGVNEDRFRPEYAGCAQAPERVREQLYSLIKPRSEVRILDLGNILAGNAVSDTQFALTKTLAAVLHQKTTCIVIGGSQDLIAALYGAFQGLTANLQMVVVDAKAEMHLHDDPTQNNYLPAIITHEPGYLFNITQAAYQGYYVEPETYDAFEHMNFDMLRLGSLRGNIQEIEPYLRDAQLMSFSMQAIRGSDAMAQLKPSPNGLSGEEACQLTRYAGLANEVKCAGFFDYNPSQDKNQASGLLLAQMIWYFIEGFTNRKADYPVAESKDYILYRTTNKNLSHEVVFYKSILSNRWWMEVPYPHERSKHEGKFLVSCSYKDYQTAQNDELPDRWMKTYQKLL
jgi:formiminoglutamase